jgi:hypothetical protein
MAELNLSQIAITAIITGITSSGSTITTIVLMRYFPKILEHFEKKVKLKNGNGKSG